MSLIDVGHARRGELQERRGQAVVGAESGHRGEGGAEPFQERIVIDASEQFTHESLERPFVGLVRMNPARPRLGFARRLAIAPVIEPRHHPAGEDANEDAAEEQRPERHVDGRKRMCAVEGIKRQRDPLPIGDDTVYTISVTNLGPSAAENVVMTDASICGLGQAAPNPVRTIQKYFPQEIV